MADNDMPADGQANALGRARAATGVHDHTHAPAASVNVGTAHHEDRARAYASGHNPKPTKAPLQDRRSVPAGAAYATSGMERAMGALADATHKPAPRRR